jgi:hypothetical protein
MAKFLYSAAMSLDGFIAGPGGDMSWMVDYLGPNPVVDELIPQTGAILAGNRTFGGDDPHKGRPGEGEVFGGGWEGPQFVLTHPPGRPGSRSDVRPRHRHGDHRVAGRGSRQVRKHPRRRRGSTVSGPGVLDEVLVCVTPVLLGDGTRLFAQPSGKTVRLEQIAVTHTPAVTNLWYRVTAWQGPVPERP